MIFLLFAHPDAVTERHFSPSTWFLPIPFTVGRKDMANSQSRIAAVSHPARASQEHFPPPTSKRSSPDVWRKESIYPSDGKSPHLSGMYEGLPLIFFFFWHYYSGLEYKRGSFNDCEVLHVPVGNPCELLINDLIANYFSTGKYARPSQSAQVHSPALGSYWLISDGMEQGCNEVVKSWGEREVGHLLKLSKHQCPAWHGKEMDN